MLLVVVIVEAAPEDVRCEVAWRMMRERRVQLNIRAVEEGLDSTATEK